MKELIFGTFKRFKDTKCVIKYLEVTDEQYEKIAEMIQRFEAEKKVYRFNVAGMFAVPFHKKIQRANSFYCAEFVKHVLEEAEVVEDLPRIIIPDDFNKVEAKEIYRGLLRKYAL